MVKREIGVSENWWTWISLILSLRTCLECRLRFGKIYAFKDRGFPPLHENCRCSWLPLPAIGVGTATDMGRDGADWWLFHNSCLPDYYLSKQEARDLGWVARKCNLSLVAPDKMLGGDVFHNLSKRLPDAPGRVWYEADINYQDGCRNMERVVYFNDGLVFVSYNHYLTFYEIVDRPMKGALTLDENDHD